jgi:hypothetical protein
MCGDQSRFVGLVESCRKWRPRWCAIRQILAEEQLFSEQQSNRPELRQPRPQVLEEDLAHLHSSDMLWASDCGGEYQLMMIGGAGQQVH